MASMMNTKPTNKISVLCDGEQWSGSHKASQYLVSNELQEDLQNGVKPYNIEKDYKEGVDYIKVYAGDLEETLDSVTDLMGIMAASNPSEKERGRLLDMIDNINTMDLQEQLELFEEDIANVMMEKLYRKLSGGEA
tara:strand:+ start:46 stop:453 length:408 start_codon:yes stop_codon:yes gene_type:complete